MVKTVPKVGKVLALIFWDPKGTSFGGISLQTKRQNSRKMIRIIKENHVFQQVNVPQKNYGSDASYSPELPLRIS